LILALVVPTASASAQDNYAAFAFSTDSGALGWGDDYDSRSGAEEEAMARCGDGCEIVLWFRNACGAIATSSDHSYGTGWADGRREAEAIAMRGCRARADECSVEHWLCTTR
jgi:serine/threonine-protein kinase